MKRPIYRHIAAKVREEIATGVIPPGAQLPTQEDLVARFGVSRGTVRRALDDLTQEGLIISRPPLGVFVRHRQLMIYRPQAEFQPRPTPTEMDWFMTTLSGEGRRPGQMIDVAVVNPPADVATRLHVKPDTAVVLRRRCRWIDGEPYNLNDSYYPHTIVANSEIMLPNDIARGCNQVLAEIGFAQVRAVDEIYLRMPNPDERYRLDLSPGTPVAVHICTGSAGDDTPVRCTVNVLPGDRHVIVYERTRSNPDPGNQS